MPIWKLTHQICVYNPGLYLACQQYHNDMGVIIERLGDNGISKWEELEFSEEV